MAALTVVGLLVASLTGAIFWKQLKEMQTDQRAWITLTPGTTEISTNAPRAGTTLTLPIVITNTGKTPARRYSVEVVMDTVQNGKAPTFTYDDIPLTTESIGIVFPNEHESITARVLRLDPNVVGGAALKILSAAEYQELVEGKTYIVVYAKSSYTDIFGTPHWHTSCLFASVSPKPMQVTAKSCTDYNDVDDN